MRTKKDQNLFTYLTVKVYEESDDYVFDFKRHQHSITASIKMLIRLFMVQHPGVDVMDYVGNLITTGQLSGNLDLFKTPPNQKIVTEEPKQVLQEQPVKETVKQNPVEKENPVEKPSSQSMIPGVPNESMSNSGGGFTDPLGISV